MRKCLTYYSAGDLSSIYRKGCRYPLDVISFATLMTVVMRIVMVR